jgi:small subunit ribosomal protein S9e
MVRVDSEKHIDYALQSPFGGGRAGRVKRGLIRRQAEKDAAGSEEEDDS